MSATVTTTLTQLPESRVRVEATVAPVEVERRMQQAARKLGGQLKIPGFRKGKVPPPVVIRRLGREHVLDEALREALGAWYTYAIDGSGIAAVGDPDINVGDLPADGAPLTFSIEVGVCPTAQLGQYKGVEVQRREPTVEEASIDAEVERLRERMATLEVVQRPAQSGDYLLMDYVGRTDGEPFDGGSARDQLIELGSQRLIPGFEEQLVGTVAGETRAITLTFPEDYGAEQLAGRIATFDVTVHEVQERHLPDADDDFASEAAGFDTLAQLREDISGRLREHEQHALEHEYETAVLDAVVADAVIDVPHALVHARAHEIVHETLESLARQGISREVYMRISGKTEEEMAEAAEQEAEQGLRREAVLAAVVQAERIEPTEEEVVEALASSVERGKTTTEKLRAQLEKDGRLVRVRADLAARKALAWLVQESKPVAPAKPKSKKKTGTAKQATVEPPAPTTVEPPAPTTVEPPAPTTGQPPAPTTGQPE
ncbi:MAG: trigger factor [Solirubrobacteraceae bacterium]